MGPNSELTFKEMYTCSHQKFSIGKIRISDMAQNCLMELVCFQLIFSVTRRYTEWSKETVTYNFSLTDLEIKKNGKTQWFLASLHREVLIFWCLKRVGWKNLEYQSWAIMGGKHHHTILAQHWKARLFSTWIFWDIKISKPPYVSLPKIIGFCHFSWFLGLSERNYKSQSLLITLYLTNSIL